MKNSILTTALLLLCFASFGQDAKVILKQSYEKCQSVENGYYEMTNYKKQIGGQDTSKTIYKCSFKKLKEDSLYSSAFHYEVFRNDTSSFEVMYTGDDFVTTFTKDSSITCPSPS